MRILILLLLTLSYAAAAPVNYEREDIAYTTFKKNPGKWDNPKNWTAGVLPEANSTPLVRNNAACTLDSVVPPVRALHVGGRETSVLTVCEGADLTVLNKLHVGRNEKSCSALLVMTGGKIRAGANEENKIARIYLGCDLTHSTPARLRIEGGEIVGGFQIGGPLANTGVGTLSVVGTAPKVKAKIPRDGMRVTPYGNLEFILGADGVAPLDFSKAGVSLEEGCLIRVDGTAYKGGAATFPLIATSKFANKGARTECVGFADNYKADIVFTSKGAQLRIKTAR